MATTAAAVELMGSVLASDVLTGEPTDGLDGDGERGASLPESAIECQPAHGVIRAFFELSVRKCTRDIGKRNAQAGFLHTRNNSSQLVCHNAPACVSNLPSVAAVLQVLG